MYRTRHNNRISYHFISNFKPFPTIKEHEVLKQPLEKVQEKPVEIPVKIPVEISEEIPTGIPVEKRTPINLPRIIYAAAQNLLRHYPMNLPVLIYQFHSNHTHTGYDVFMEKTEKGWKEWVNMYPFYTNLEHDFYLIEGLALAVQQELEMTEILPALMSQADWLHRLMD